MHCEYKASQATREDIRAGYERIARVWAGLARNVEIRQKLHNSTSQKSPLQKVAGKRGDDA